MDTYLPEIAVCMIVAVFPSFLALPLMSIIFILLNLLLQFFRPIYDGLYRKAYLQYSQRNR